MTVYFSELNCVMPREKDPVWRDFTEVLINGVKRAKCKKCGVDQCAIVQRMKEHACAKEEHESVQTTPSAPKKPRQSTMDNFCGGSRPLKHELDLQVTR